MKELSESHIEKVISLLEKGKTLPEHYKDALISDLKRLKTSLLFDTKPVPAGSKPLRFEDME
jgi:mRNA-degrading endonuclease YafQ of YafQ-DinJ toxin-antitoxin module